MPSPSSRRRTFGRTLERVYLRVGHGRSRITCLRRVVFQVQQVGYGAAISTALTVVIIVFSVVFTIIQKRVEKNMV